MKCSNCGAENNEQSRYCAVCGQSLISLQSKGQSDGQNVPQSNVQNNYQNTQQSSIPNNNGYNGYQGTPQMYQGGKKGGFKKIAIIVGIVMLVVVGIIAALVAIDDADRNSKVDMVKNASPHDYPNITYEQAFNYFFTNPKWKYFDSEQGYKVVQFDGNATVYDEAGTVTIQFIFSDDEKTFRWGYVDLSGEKQSDGFKSVMLKTIFDEYQQDHGGSKDSSADASSSLDDLDPAHKEYIVDIVQPRYVGSCKYATYDMNNDGSDELFVSHGTMTADWQIEVYDIVDGESYMCGIYYGDAKLHEPVDGDGVYAVYAHGGYETIDYLTLIDGVYNSTNIVPSHEIEDFYDTTPEIPWHEVELENKG